MANDLEPGTADAVPRATSVLAVCAHPDDESFGLGAALSAFVDSGCATAVLCLTHGEASTLGEAPTLGAGLGRTRATELAAASFELGVGHVELFGYPDGKLDEQPLDSLVNHVCQVAERVSADLLLVFDEDGITGHRDHCRATEAALAHADQAGLPVLAWAVPAGVAAALNGEYSAGFVGRRREDLHLSLHVDRTRQHRAIARHASQSTTNPVLWRRLELQGDREAFVWLRPAAPSPLSAARAAPGKGPCSTRPCGGG